MSQELAISQREIENRIFTIRGLQIMLDTHLAEMYHVKPIRLREQVKRNTARFPANFMFQLTEEEVDFMVSQNAIPSRKYLGGYLPYVFTEQGVAMLSAVLRSSTAVKVSIKIMNAFVEMRKLIIGNAALFQRLDKIEWRQMENDKKFEKIFKALESKELPEKGVFFDGQVFDAYVFAAKLIRQAEDSIVLIDNYIDDSVLTLFLKRKKGVSLTCYTKKINKQLKLDVEKHNSQYAAVMIKEFENAHDRFLIIDDQRLYHIGASLKDLGKKWFAFSKIDMEVLPLLRKLEGQKEG